MSEHISQNVAIGERVPAIDKEGPSSVWPKLLKQEDWWPVILGFALIIASLIFWLNGSTLFKVIAVSFPSWNSFGVMSSNVGRNIGNLILLYLLFLTLFGIAVKFLGYNLKKFAMGFTVVFVLSLLVLIFGSWSTAKKYNLEAPLVALALGLILSNLLPIPKWLDDALRTEFYVKTGIVLLGATLPFTLLIQAGPVAFAQATAISVTTFSTIYFAGTRWFGLDKRFAATLAAGGSICGVSASIAIGGSVKAEKQQVSAAISLVIVWAVVMIFVLPFVIKALSIPAGPAGAWIGTSEFADAAGMAAAASINEQAIKTFTLNKVVGRDMFIGIWAAIMAFIAVTKWEKKDGAKLDAKQVWVRFPKFVLGFLLASALVSLIAVSAGDSGAKTLNANIIGPLKELRTWAFTFTFLSIGLTTRFRELTNLGWRPLAAFTTGVLVNVPLGFILSVLLLGNYWANVK